MLRQAALHRCNVGNICINTIFKKTEKVIYNSANIRWDLYCDMNVILTVTWKISFMTLKSKKLNFELELLRFKKGHKDNKSIIKVLNMTCVPYFLQLYDRFMWWTDWILYLILILLTLSLPSLGLKLKNL